MRVTSRSQTYEVVGVVKDAKYDDLREPDKPFVYLAASQDTRPASMTFYVRSPLPVESLGDPSARPSGSWTRTCRSALCRRCRGG